MLNWGVNERVDDATGRVSYDMSLQFPRPDDMTPQMQMVLDALIAMEDKIKQDAIANSKEWFNKAKLTSGQVDVLFNKMLYWPIDKETGERREGASPTLRLKLDCWDGVFKSEVYDMDSQPLYPSKDEGGPTPVDLITKGSQVACLAKSGGIYFIAGKFGVTWRLAQAVVKPRQRLSGRCLIQLNAGERKVLEAQKDEDNDEQSVQMVDSDDDDDDDDDEDDDDNASSSSATKKQAKVEVAKVVEAAKPKKERKRVVRRKKKEEA